MIQTSDINKVWYTSFLEKYNLSNNKSKTSTGEITAISESSNLPELKTFEDYLQMKIDHRKKISGKLQD